MSVERMGKKVNRCQGGMEGDVAEHTDDELFNAEITHCVCRGCFCFGLANGVSVPS
jgi:hypothetical protein